MGVVFKPFLENRLMFYKNSCFHDFVSNRFCERLSLIECLFLEKASKHQLGITDRPRHETRHRNQITN